MSDPIRVHRSEVTDVPPSLAAGEIAYSEKSGHFFYGRIADGTPVVIGGKTAIDKLSTIEEGAEVNTVTNVAGKTGEVTLETGDIQGFAAEVITLIEETDLGDLANVSVSSPSDKQVLSWDADSKRWVAVAPGTGVTQFTSLNDTPTDFSGAANYLVKVNSAGDALEYVEGIDGGTF